MGQYYITHTRKDGADYDRRIDAVMVAGGIYAIDTVIDWINTHTHRFFVNVWGRAVEVVTRVHPTSRRWYLTTEADGYPPNNLLNLPDC
jgi:hypothetical protein